MVNSRQQFEKWFVTWVCEGSALGWLSFRIFFGVYSEYIINGMWQVWQASRSSIVLDVNWPDSNDDWYKEGDVGVFAQGYEDGRDKTVVSVVSAAIASGIKLKGIKETGG